MADDYNPLDHRPPEIVVSSTFAVFVHLLKAALGSGILLLPYAFMQAGYIVAIICSVFIGTITIHTAVITVQCGQILMRRSKTPTLNFAETAETSFKLGPEPIQKYSRAFFHSTNVIICFVQFSTAIVYSLYVVTSLQQVIEYMTKYEMDTRMYLLILMPVFCAMALIPNFKYLVPFSIMGFVFLAFGFFATMYYLIEDFQSPSRLKGFGKIEEIPIYCGVFLFAVHNMSMLMPLENSMKNPSKMPLVLTISMIINIGANVIFGFLGYNKYIDTCDTIVKNLPLEDLLAQVVKIAIALSVLFTYGLQYYVPITIIWPLLETKIHNENRRWIYEQFFRLGGSIMCSLLAIAIPHLVPLLGLFSALSVTTVMLLIPVMIELATKYNDDRTFFYYLMILKNFFIAAVWLFLLVFGVIESVKAIILAFGDDDGQNQRCKHINLMLQHQQSQNENSDQNQNFTVSTARSSTESELSKNDKTKHRREVEDVDLGEILDSFLR